MKKIFSIMLSLVMLLSFSAVSMNALAATVGSIETTTRQNEIEVQVNGQPSNDATYSKDPQDPKKITFAYIGEDDLQNWTFPGMREGTDYTIVSQNGNAIVIQVAKDYQGKVVANALVNHANDDYEEDEDGDADEYEEDDDTTVKNGESTSPKTGMDGTYAAMSACLSAVTVLAAAASKKKKETAE